jgi:TRAP-type C4-dicarboxylate transport system permease small subunit
MTNLDIPPEIAAREDAAVGTVPARRSLVRRVLDALYYFSALSGAVAVVSVMLLMLLQVAYRQAGYIFRGADDLTAWSCAAAVFLPLAHTFKKGELVRMGLVMEHFHGAARRACELFSLLSATSFIGYGTYWAVTVAYQSWLIGDRAQGLIPVPMWIPQSSMSIGLALLLVALIDETVMVLRGHASGYEKAARDRRVGGEFSGKM